MFLFQSKKITLYVLNRLVLLIKILIYNKLYKLTINIFKDQRKKNNLKVKFEKMFIKFTTN